MSETLATTNSPPTSEAKNAARELYGLGSTELTHLCGGRTHDTFKVKSSTGLFILQRLNAFFGGHQALGLNWHTVYQALEQRSNNLTVPMPPIFPDLSGRYLSSIPNEDSSHWRLTGYIAGQSPPRTAAGASKAARLLGFCHCHLNRPAPLDLLPLPIEGEFTNCRRTRAEDFTDLAELYWGHPRLKEMKATLEQASEAADKLPLHPDFVQVFNRQDLIIHGDPKADNFLFTPEGKAQALLDWDTVQLGDILVDIAEMLRSWSTPPKPSFPEAGLPTLHQPMEHGLSTLAAVVEGYAETGLDLSSTEVGLLPPVLRALTLNLCRRYLTDALAQVYFQWDSQTYPSLYHQNMARARSLMTQVKEIFLREMELIEAFQKAYSLGLSRRISP